MKSISKILILGMISTPFISAADVGDSPEKIDDLNASIESIVNNIVGGLKTEPTLIASAIKDVANNVIRSIDINQPIKRVLQRPIPIWQWPGLPLSRTMMGLRRQIQTSQQSRGVLTVSSSSIS
ncbi:hypothetical protein [Edwardsiella anguillarum]|uniref:hypothetical protein n=1 Tax=Edwardsiella anguillarum TaxID=1821960 RepID=UPI0011865A48|nr:hypothetical protein [Edwardsiella anguillarum]